MAERVKPITDERLGILADALLRDPDVQPSGHWIQGVTRGFTGVYLTRDELINLVATAVVVEAECIKYGLEDMGGNHAQVLLRHMAGSKAVTLGAKDALIAILQRKLLAADALAAEAGARKYSTFNDLQARVANYRQAK